MTHDPLCYWHDHYKGPTPVQVDPENDKWEWIDVCNDCDLIAKTREDERSAAVQRVEALANEMRNWSSAETTAATEAVPDLTFDQWLWVQRGVLRSIAAIKGDQP